MKNYTARLKAIQKSIPSPGTRLSRIFDKVGDRYRDILTGQLWTLSEIHSWGGVAIIDDI